MLDSRTDLNELKKNNVKKINLDADTTTDAKLFRDESNLGVWRSFNTKLAHTNDWTRLFALLTAFFRFATIIAHDGYSGQRVLLLLISPIGPFRAHFLQLVDYKSL